MKYVLSDWQKLRATLVEALLQDINHIRHRGQEFAEQETHHLNFSSEISVQSELYSSLLRDTFVPYRA